MDFILHLTRWLDWTVARRDGLYRAPSLGQEGFIHCSTNDQILRVANTFYRGQAGSILLLIDPAELQSELRWEPGADRPDELFPHVYGPINLDAVALLLPLPIQGDEYVLPIELLDFSLGGPWREKVAAIVSEQEQIRIEARFVQGRDVEYHAEMPDESRIRFLWQDKVVYQESIPLAQADTPRQAEAIIRDFLHWKMMLP